MDDRKLQVLLVTIRTGSFSKAAKELNCTQSAVTQIMNNIEEELGCQVLQRSHKGVNLTAAGEALYPLIIEADAGLIRLQEEAQKVADGQAIPIRLGSFSSISNTWLPAALRDYQAIHPDITFDVRIGTDTVPEWLLSGEIDVGLGDSRRCQGFRWYPLMEDSFCAVVPESYVGEEAVSITQQALAEYVFIMAPMNALERCLQVLPRRQIRVASDDDSTLLSMVGQGLGVTIMPELSLQNIPDSVRILDLEPPVPRTLGVALPKLPSKAALAFAQYLRQRYPYIP